MGLWRDLNGDGNFQPGAADGSAFTTCITVATGACDFTNLAAGVPTGSRRCLRPPGVTWNAIADWGPGGSSTANNPVPYAAVRNGDPAATLSSGGPDLHGRLPDHRGRHRQPTGGVRTTSPTAGRTRPSATSPARACFRIVLVLDRSGIDPDKTAWPPTRTPSPASSTTSWAPTPRSGSCPSRRAPRWRQGYTSVLGGPSGGADQRDQQRLQQHGRRHQLGCRPVRGQWPLHRGSRPRRHGHGRQPDR